MQQDHCTQPAQTSFSAEFSDYRDLPIRASIAHLSVTAPCYRLGDREVVGMRVHSTDPSPPYRRSTRIRRSAGCRQTAYSAGSAGPGTQNADCRLGRTASVFPRTSRWPHHEGVTRPDAGSGRFSERAAGQRRDSHRSGPQHLCFTASRHSDACGHDDTTTAHFATGAGHRLAHIASIPADLISGNHHYPR
ncbi:hypothetical protein D3C75_880120 [compost metagenome]